jgi:GxxExxY protein
MSVGGSTLKHAAITEKIIGVFFAVYNELGHGWFLESVYQNAMVIALIQAGLKVEREVPVPVFFRGQVVGDYRADLLVEGVVLVELKTVRVLEPSHEAQLFHYLRATNIEVGLLLNFAAKAPFKRIAFENARKKSCSNSASEVGDGLHTPASEI